MVKVIAGMTFFEMSEEQRDKFHRVNTVCPAPVKEDDGSWGRCGGRMDPIGSFGVVCSDCSMIWLAEERMFRAPN